MRKNKKSYSKFFSSYSFLSPLGWSLENKDYLGIILSASIWFTATIFIFFITYFTWIINTISIQKVRFYLDSGRYLPIAVLALSFAVRFCVYNRDNKNTVINNKFKLYYYRSLLFIKYFILLLAIPFINNLVINIDINILNELTRLSQKDVLDIVLRAFLGQ